MTPPTPASPGPSPGPSPEAVGRWISGQRWFASTDHGPADDDDDGDGDGDGDGHPITLSEPLPLPGAPRVGVVLATTADGRRYQLVLPLGGRTRRSAGSSPTVSNVIDVIDVADGTDAAKALTRLTVDAETVPAPFGTVEGHWLAGAPRPGRRLPRALGADQSNTSAVVGGTHVLKVLRRLVTGTHPEVEVGRHLHEQAAATGVTLPVAPLAGWYDLVEPSGARTTLGVLHRFVRGGTDGWALVLSALAADPGSVLTRLHRLGEDLARLHGALARPGSAGGFGAEPVSPSDLADIAARTVTAAAAVERPLGHHLLTRLDQTLGALIAHLAITDAGAAIRTHGDLHLGQTLVVDDGWIVLDFEGEPTRPLEERRRHHPALRDVAGLLRSLSYAAETVRRAGGRRVTDGWEPAARAALLDGYLAAIDPALVPPSAATTTSLLALFEVERAVYEVGYELAHRPDWMQLPVSGLARALHRVHHREEAP